MAWRFFKSHWISPDGLLQVAASSTLWRCVGCWQDHSEILERTSSTFLLPRLIGVVRNDNFYLQAYIRLSMVPFWLLRESWCLRALVAAMLLQNEWF